MKIDYSDIGMDMQLQATDGLAAKQRPLIRGLQANYGIEVQAKNIVASRINLTGLVNKSLGDVVTGTLSTGSILNLTSTITFKIPYQNKSVFGNAYVALYQGTVLGGSSQIYPAKGGSVTAGRYIVQGFYDYQTWNGTQNIWKGMLIDTTGTSSQVISFAANWYFLNYTAGSAT